jgi:NAD-specific glutamate dehydrogenase
MNESAAAVDQETAGRRLIEQMGTILKGLRDDMPASFAPALFEHAASEDLVQYEARELAALAEDAWTFLMDRPRGTQKVRVESRDGPVGA